MNFKKFISGVSALTIAASAFAGMAVTANAATVYSTDFSTDTLTSMFTWTEGSKTTDGYNSKLVLGRAGSIAVENGALHFSATGTKNNSSVSSAVYGILGSTEGTTAANITAAGDTGYTLSFTWRPVVGAHYNGNTFIEFINENKNVILGLNVAHSRNNSTTGTNTVQYYSGGSCGFAVQEATISGSNVNAETGIGSATKNTVETVSGTTFDKTYKIELTMSSTGAGTLTVKDSEDKVIVNAASVSTDSAGISAICMNGFHWTSNTGASNGKSDEYIDDLSIEDASVNYVGYTVQYLLEDGTTPVKDPVTRYGTEGDSISLTSDDTATTVVKDGTTYYYVTNDVSGKTIDADGNTVVTVTYRNASPYTATVNAIGDDDVSLGSFSAPVADTSIKGYVQYPVIIKNGSDWYKFDASSRLSGYYQEELTNAVSSKTAVYEKQSDTLAYYGEFEDVDNVSINGSGTYADRYSNGKCVRGGSLTTDSLPTGTYKVYVGARNGSSSTTRTITVSGGDEEKTIEVAKATAISHNPSNVTVTLSTAGALTISGENNDMQMDYVYIVDVTESTYDTHPTLVGTFENGTGSYAAAYRFKVTPNAFTITSVTVNAEGATGDAEIPKTGLKLSGHGDIYFGIIATYTETAPDANAFTVSIN